MPFERLFKRLESHGIDGNLLDWIKQWLSGRRQRVCINREYSDRKDATSGVPQGSVLGPVLFTIYINDLDVSLVSKIGKFADDTKLCKGVKDQSDVENLQQDLCKLELWAKEW